MKNKETSFLKEARGSLLQFFLVVATTLFLVLVAEYAWTEHSSKLQHAVAYTTLVSALCVPFFVLRELRDNVFHLYAYYGIRVAVGLGLGAGVYHFGFVSRNYSPAIFTEICYVAAAGLACIFIGYISPVGRYMADRVPLLAFPNNSKTRPDSGWGPYVTSLLILYLAGWLARNVGTALGIYHLSGSGGDTFVRFNFIWTALPLFSKVSFFLIMGVWLSRRIEFKLPTVIPVTFIILEVGAGAIGGSRSRMVIPLILVLIAYHYTRRKISWKVIFAGTIALIFFVLPLTTLYRSAYRTQVSAGEEIGVNTAIDAAGESNRSTASAFDPTLARLTVRFQALGRVLDRVPERYSFQRGDTFVEGMYMSFVPRILYPEKKNYNATREYAILFFDAPKETTTNTSITTQGELYFNFGYVGLIWMTLLGVLFRFFWVRFRHLAQLEFLPLHRLHFLLFAVSGISTLATYPAGLTRTAIVYYICLILIHRRLPTLKLPNPSAS